MSGNYETNKQLLKNGNFGSTPVTVVGTIESTITDSLSSISNRVQSLQGKNYRGWNTAIGSLVAGVPIYFLIESPLEKIVEINSQINFNAGSSVGNINFEIMENYEDGFVSAHIKTDIDNRNSGLDSNHQSKINQVDPALPLTFTSKLPPKLISYNGTNQSKTIVKGDDLESYIIGDLISINNILVKIESTATVTDFQMAFSFIELTKAELLPLFENTLIIDNITATTADIKFTQLNGSKYHLIELFQNNILVYVVQTPEGIYQSNITNLNASTIYNLVITPTDEFYTKLIGDGVVVLNDNFTTLAVFT
jgi:hypothetical protein